ncbi:hypothetical protein Pan216_00250 [Planctomycetes bacterium Pan216]|uniref:Uncharacterized protein n=1 Tax=Kolteria novifilia TaxID=2527975 RepID=A0A518AWV8_9BACT|nr:hypothetical protein Pan216_00250 [Planctomycetes bacterium Pan216]
MRATTLLGSVSTRGSVRDGVDRRRKVEHLDGLSRRHVSKAMAYALDLGALRAKDPRNLFVELVAWNAP